MVKVTDWWEADQEAIKKAQEDLDKFNREDEIDKLENKIYIATENSSGAIYDGSTPEDVGFAVQCYCEDYLEGEF